MKPKRNQELIDRLKKAYSDSIALYSTKQDLAILEATLEYIKNTKVEENFDGTISTLESTIPSDSLAEILFIIQICCVFGIKYTKELKKKGFFNLIYKKAIVKGFLTEYEEILEINIKTFQKEVKELDSDNKKHS